MPQHRKWGFIVNPFLVEGKRNFKKAFELAKYTDNALLGQIADAFFLGLYNAFHPLFVALKQEYEDWSSQKGIQKGATLNLDQLLEQLGSGEPDLGINSFINDWDVMVQTVFAKHSPNYMTIFPRGRQPFQKGEKDVRINAVSALSLALAPHAGLAALKVTVDAFLASLDSARNTQEIQITDTGIDSDEVQATVTAAMVGMFAVYGGLIQHFASTPDDVAIFFDLELLRDLPQTEWTKTIQTSTAASIFKRTLDPNRKVKIVVLSDKALDFYVVPEKNDTVAANKITVQGLEDEIVPWGMITNGPGSAYFNVTNADPDVEGQFKIEILPEGD